MISNYIIVGGTTGLSPSFIAKLNSLGHQTRRVQWEAPRTSWEPLQAALEAEIEQCRRPYCLVIVSHLKGFYTQLFQFLLDLEFLKRPAKIIMLGSTTSDRLKSSLDIYNAEKKLLADLVLQIQQDTSAPPIMLLRPGAIDTERVRSMPGKKFTADQFSDLIVRLLEIENDYQIDILNIKTIKTI